MIPKPLKGKRVLDKNKVFRNFREADIRSAVEWLKDRIIEQPIDDKIEMRAIYCHLVDDAFEDVTK